MFFEDMTGSHTKISTFNYGYFFSHFLCSIGKHWKTTRSFNQRGDLSKSIVFFPINWNTSSSLPPIIHVVVALHLCQLLVPKRVFHSCKWVYFFHLFSLLKSSRCGPHLKENDSASGLMKNRGFPDGPTTNYPADSGNSTRTLAHADDYSLLQ